MTPCDEAHLYVAAIRVLQYKKSGAPSMEDLCALLQVSTEAGHAVCRRLKKAGVLDVTEDPFTVKLSIADHREIEKMERAEQGENSLARELEQYMTKKKDMDKKVEAIQAELDRKKQAMFSEIDRKLKKKQ